jgi:hypothetical protein
VEDIRGGGAWFRHRCDMWRLEPVTSKQRHTHKHKVHYDSDNSQNHGKCRKKAFRLLMGLSPYFCPMNAVPEFEIEHACLRSMTVVLKLRRLGFLHGSRYGHLVLASQRQGYPYRSDCQACGSKYNETVKSVVMKSFGL